MKAEAQIKVESQKPAPPAVPDRVSDDPFSGDLFASHRTPEADAKAVTAQISRREVRFANAWYSRLPRVTADEVAASSAMSALPAEFYTLLREAAKGVLSRYLLAPEQVYLALIDMHEAPFSAVPGSQGSPRVFASFVCEPNRNPFSLELDAGFAITLVDRMLGGNGDQPDSLRPLTTAELAVVEFLLIALTRAVNQRVDSPLIHLESVGERSSWLGGLPGSAHARTSDLRPQGLAFAWRIEVGEITGIAHAHLPAQSLVYINRAMEQFRATTTTRGLEHVKTRMRAYASIVPDLGLSILVGRTDLAAGEFELLECGDVMLVESPEIVWRGGQIVGALRVRVADGEGALILGDVSELNQSTIKLHVASVTMGEPADFAERLNMQEETEIEEVAPPVNGIDGVMLTLRVELAARRLRLDELARLRPDQILDLGCQATDLVSLMIDGHQVARGELVDIEGGLGVRITQVSTQSA